jgi:quercetin dioxygenase-like cupin family protein
LGQIERGESSPSISVLWKISEGLKVSFNSLTKEHEKMVEKIKINKPKSYDDGNFRLYPIETFSHDKNYEMYRVEIESQGRFISNPHAKNSVEYVTVYKGGITIIVGEESYYVDKGESLKFESDIEHQYINDSLIQSEFSIIVFYR